jgi:hypothetical protein
MIARLPSDDRSLGSPPRSRWRSLLLLAIALVTGPGYALTEAWVHAHRSGPGHGQAPHLETPSTWDHDDACGIGLQSNRAAPPRCGLATIRLADPAVRSLPADRDHVVASAPTRLPPPRGPPDRT